MKTPKPERDDPMVFTAATVSRFLNAGDPRSTVVVLLGDQKYQIDVLALGTEGILCLGVSKMQLKQAKKVKTK